MRNVTLFIFSVLLCLVCGCRSASVATSSVTAVGELQHDSLSATVSVTASDSVSDIFHSFDSSESASLEIEFNDSGVPKKLLLQKEAVSHVQSQSKTEKSESGKDETIDWDAWLLHLDSLYMANMEAAGTPAEAITGVEKPNKWKWFLWGAIIGLLAWWNLKYFIIKPWLKKR